MFTWNKEKSQKQKKDHVRKAWKIELDAQICKEKKSRSLPASMHQWILQGNGKITLELERGWVSLSPKEIILTGWVSLSPKEIILTEVLNSEFNYVFIKVLCLKNKLELLRKSIDTS